jgi:phosphoserine phosphatase
MPAGYKAVVFDVDGVITPFRSAWQRLHAILETQGGLNRALYKLGLIDYYEWALYDALLWHGAPRRVVEARFQTLRGFEELCSLLSEAGVYSIAVSAGIGYTRAPLSRCFHFYVTNELIFEDNAVRTVAVYVTESNKDEVVDKILELLGVGWRETVAVGDSASDLPVLKRAGFSIAFNPSDEEVARSAHVVIRARSLRPLVKYLRALLAGLVDAGSTQRHKASCS